MLRASVAECLSAAASVFYKLLRQRVRKPGPLANGDRPNEPDGLRMHQGCLRSGTGVLRVGAGSLDLLRGS